MNDPRRFFRYVLAFAGMLTALYAVTGLLGLAVTTIALRGDVLTGAEDARIRASLYLAALIVGTPVWLGFWMASRRRALGSEEERDSSERRLFLGAVFALTSVVALYALHTFLRYLFTLPGAGDAEPTGRNAVFAAARLLTYGAAWLYHARIGWRERSPRDEDALHDLAVYVLAGFSLAFLASGVAQAISQILRDLIGSTQPALLAEPVRSVWDRWGGIAAWLLSGGPVWAAIWQYDLARGGARRVRVVYLYIVLLAAVPTTLGSAAQGLYELLRRLFGYRPQGQAMWGFLADFLPLLLVAGAVWAHHWAVARSQAAPEGGGERRVPGGIIWPRRLGIALLTLLGLAVVAPALVSVLWLALDFLLNTGRSLSGPGWWRDRLSVSIAAGLVGIPAWLGGWTLLQRAAEAAPERECTAGERRQLLGLVVLASALVTIGFAVALLWLVLQALLGGGLDANDVSRMLKYLSATAVALAVLAYHGITLRRDLAFGPTRTGRVRVVALVAPGAEDALARLREETGHRIEVIGHLSDAGNGTWVDLPALEERLAELGAVGDGRSDRALLLLGPDGGSLHPYSRRKP